jgi:hypothetical protein
MTSPTSLTHRALARAGLLDLVEARLDPLREADARARLESEIDGVDPILLGAMADRVRDAERGDAVRIYLDAPIALESGSLRVVPSAWKPSDGGLAFVRAIAAARLLGPRGTSLLVDVERVGIQLAQLALAWGADAWVAKLQALAIQIVEEHDDEEPHGLVSLGSAPALGDRERAILKEREIAGLVRLAKRHPRIVERRGVVELEREVDETTVARRKFRAPGREVAEMRAARAE